MTLTLRPPMRVTLLSVLLFGLLAQAQSPARAEQYSGPNRIVSLNVPKAPNWDGVPYKVTPLDTKGDRRYDKVMLHADDFGQYLVVGVRMMPSASVVEMNKDEPKLVLKNLSQATLMGWRTDLYALPEVLEESFRDSKHGYAIVRVYRAKKGSILVKADGRRPTRDDAFDTNIASVVARRGAVVVFVLAQNDASPDDSKSVVKMAAELFDELRVAAGDVDVDIAKLYDEFNAALRQVGPNDPDALSRFYSKAYRAANRCAFFDSNCRMSGRIFNEVITLTTHEIVSIENLADGSVDLMVSGNNSEGVGVGLIVNWLFEDGRWRIHSIAKGPPDRDELKRRFSIEKPRPKPVTPN